MDDLKRVFEKRSKRQKIVIYATISAIVSLLLSFLHFFLQGWNIYIVVVVANIEFFCLFYILYLPLKMKEKQK